MYKLDERLLKTATEELLKEIRKHKSQKEQNIEFDNGFFKIEEGYKYDVYEQGRSALNIEAWTEEMIGTHVIADNVKKAFEKAQNLIFYMTNDFFEKLNQNVYVAERILYDVFKSDDVIGEQKAFEKYMNYFGRNYSRIAFLYFLKDKDRYLPISPEKFKELFEWLNIYTDCCNGCTWVHYQEFNKIIGDIQHRLLPYFNHRVSLVDAHSFIWSMYLLEKRFKSSEINFVDYSKGQVCLNEEQWKKALMDDTVIRKDYLELLAKIYLANDHATVCKDLAYEDKVDVAVYNSAIRSMGKRITKSFNLHEMKRENGQGYYWPIFFYGRSLMNGLFEWQMRPELVTAFEDVCKDIVLIVQEKQEEREVAGLPDFEIFKRAKEKSNRTPLVRTVTTEQKYRDPGIAEWAKRRAKGVCLLCGEDAPFNDKYGRPYLESHHIEWLSEGGADSIDNVVALCPNCHRKMHVLKDTTEEQEAKQFLKDCILDYLKREEKKY